MYTDPESFNTTEPILFWDCEGLKGGETHPMGISETDGQEITRRLLWANSEERGTREFVTEALYPRIVYTFSDVLIFVMRNER